MVALKAGDIDRFVAKPPASVHAILVYGPDMGLVSERAQALVAAVSGGNNDPFSLAKIDAGDIVSDPNRLIDEALTIPSSAENAPSGSRTVVARTCLRPSRRFLPSRIARLSSSSKPET
ncbi:hypothetical protein V6L77_11540 [Pannonibacter sp. Pt2-lr]